MNETKEKTVPARKASPGPAGLDGIQISGCAFTESVGKKEPRPPLYCTFLHSSGLPTGNVVVRFGQSCAYVRIIKRISHGSIPCEYGKTYPCGFKFSVPYTGPISKSMWIEIRKWWNP